MLMMCYVATSFLLVVITIYMQLNICSMTSVFPFLHFIAFIRFPFYEFIKTCYRLVPAQDVHFFYTRSHLSAFQNCALLFLTNSQFIIIFKKCRTQFSHWIALYIILFFKNIVQLFIKITHSYVAIELLTYCKNAKKNYFIAQERSHYFG